MHSASPRLFGSACFFGCSFLPRPSGSTNCSLRCVLVEVASKTVGCERRKHLVRDQSSKAPQLASYTPYGPARVLATCPSATATCQASHCSKR